MNKINTDGAVVFSKKAGFDLFLKLCEAGEIPIKFSQDMVSKSKQTIYFHHFVSDRRLIFYITHFISAIDLYADLNIKSVDVGKIIRLRNGKVKIYNLIQTSKLTDEYLIPKSEYYYFKKKIYDITKDNKLGRELLTMKLKMGNKNGTQSINR